MMDFLCLINLFFFVFLTIYYPIYISKSLKLKLLNPITILVVVTMPIALFKAFFGPAYLLNDGLFDKYCYSDGKYSVNNNSVCYNNII
jgi:hypothetical protein